MKEPSITRGILQLEGDCCGKRRKLEVYEAPKQLRPYRRDTPHMMGVIVDSRCPLQGLRGKM